MRGLLDSMENIQYYEHTCACDCGGQIEIRKSHKKDGIPIYIHNHHTKGKKRKPFTEEHCNNISKAAKERLKDKESHPFYGKKLTEEHKNNISEARIENKSAKGENNPMFGKNHTEETRQKIKENHVDVSGENNPNWCGGTSNYKFYGSAFTKLVKQQILERDNYKCQYPTCVEIHDRLCVHHIDYNKKNNNPENLITLGDSCHSKTNSKNNRQYWSEFYQNIMREKCNSELL